jgi:hypothetical protein
VQIMQRDEKSAADDGDVTTWSLLPATPAK